METLTELWLAILVSAVFVFVASSVLHMCLPIHKSDYKKLPNEAGVLGDLRNQGINGPGEYMFPCAESMKDMGTPEMIEKYKQGPVGFLLVLPSGVPNIGKSLAQWFLFSIVVSVFVAYIAYQGIGPDADPRHVFRMTATTAFLAYAVTDIPNAIWKGHSWVTAAKFVFDGLVYGLVTGLAFAWLW